MRMHPTLPPSRVFLLLQTLLCSLHPISSLSSPNPDPPSSAPPILDIPSLMSKNGCKTFASLLTSTADAADSYSSNLDSGLTAFCPVDRATNPFLPLFKNLSADDKLSLLLYHAVPLYFSLRMLQSNNGVVNTLATDGTTKNYNFTVQNDGEAVTLQTQVATARVTDTVVDRDPVAVYAIDAVLQPRELFKPVEVPVPAPVPAPEAVADSPKSGKSGRNHTAPSGADSPASSADGKSAKQEAADGNAAAASRRCFAGAAAAVVVLVALF